MRRYKRDSENKSYIIFLSFSLILIVILFSVGYSAFNKKLNITGIVADVKIEEDIRVNYDNSKERMNKKLQDSMNIKNPITVIIGDNERDNNLISYRKYGSEETVSMPIEEFISYIKEEIKKR